MIVRIYTLHDPRCPEEIRYVGQTVKTLSVRLSKHFSEAKKRYGTVNTSHRCNWIGSLLKDGVRPVQILIEETDEFNYVVREKFWIADYRFKGHRLTNATNGGEGCLGWVPNEEQRAKMSLRSKGLKHSEESKRKISEHNKGKFHTEQSKKKMSESKKGHIVTLEARRKIGKSSEGRLCSEITRRRMSQSLIGKKPSEETRIKLRDAALGRVHTEETKLKISKSKKGVPSGRLGILSPVFGKKLSKEHKLKISEAHKGHIVTEETRRKIGEAARRRFYEKNIFMPPLPPVTLPQPSGQGHPSPRRAETGSRPAGARIHSGHP